MRTLLAAAVVLAFATPAAADTLQEVTTKGIVLSVQGMDIDVTYTPDGKFTAMDGQVTGDWRRDGEKLCTKVGTDPEVCAIYPAGKTSGDSFDVPGAMGPQMGTIEVTIR